MRVILDTNIFLSATLVRGSVPDKLYESWRKGRYLLISSEQQIDEIKAVFRRPFFRDRVLPRYPPYR